MGSPRRIRKLNKEHLGGIQNMNAARHTPTWLYGGSEVQEKHHSRIVIMIEDRVTHESPWPQWYATQDALRGVWLCDRASDRKAKVEPPAEWGGIGCGT